MGGAASHITKVMDARKDEKLELFCNQSTTQAVKKKSYSKTFRSSPFF